MKKFYFRTATIATLLLTGLLAGCGTYGIGTVQDDALEPNNNKSEATEVSIDYQADLVLQDDDWFKLTLNEGKLVRIAMEAPSATYWSASAALYRGDSGYHAQLNFGDNQTLDEDIYIPAGTHYLNVSGYIESKRRAYSLSFAETVLPDAPLEPNDTAQTATQLDFADVEQTMFLQEDRGDEDWFTFTLSEARILTFNFGEGYNYAPNRALYDEKLQFLNEGGYGEIHDALYESVPLALGPGTYYLRLYEDENSGIGGLTYTLSAMSEPAPDKPFEPNNSFNDATDIALPFSGKFFVYKGDEDWFRFRLLSEQLVTVVTRQDSSADLYDYYYLSGHIYRDSGEIVQEFTASPEEAADSFVLPAGTYHLSLSKPFHEEDDYAHQNVIYPLTIKSEDVPTPDYEPNNAPSNAHAITLGFSQDALLVSEEDSDWFTFVVDQTKQVVIALREYDNGFPFVKLHDANGERVIETDNGLLSTVLTAGTYNLEIINGYSSLVTKYGISVTEK